VIADEPPIGTTRKTCGTFDGDGIVDDLRQLGDRFHGYGYGPAASERASGRW